MQMMGLNVPVTDHWCNSDLDPFRELRGKEFVILVVNSEWTMALSTTTPPTESPFGAKLQLPLLQLTFDSLPRLDNAEGNFLVSGTRP